MTKVEIINKIRHIDDSYSLSFLWNINKPSLLRILKQLHFKVKQKGKTINKDD